MMMLGYSYTADTYQSQISVVLTKLLEQTIASDKSKDMFIAAMSHEFRNPLNSILGSIEIIKSELTPDQRDLLETMSNWGEILLNLINNILDVSKL